MDLLSTKSIKPSDIPSEDAILAAGRDLLESTSSWKQAKTYFKTVKSLYNPKGPGGKPWHCRVSQHSSDEISFDDLWNGLGKNKAENEKCFIPEIKKVALVKSISPSQMIWTLYYTFTPPISPRVYTELQVTHLDEAQLRTGIVVSIPIDLTRPGDEELAKIEERGVKATYVSVEWLRELGDGQTEWRMAVSSHTGGSLPTFLVEASLAKEIAKDVPYFIKWFHSHKAQPDPPETSEEATLKQL